MNNSLFDDLMRQKANNHEAPVPDTAWENIFPKEKKRRMPILWLFLIPLLMAGAGFWVYHGQSTKKQTASQTKNIQQQQANKNQRTKESAPDIIVDETSQQKPAADEIVPLNPGNENRASAKEQKSIADPAVNAGTNAAQKPASKLVSVNETSGKMAKADGTYAGSGNATVNGQSMDVLQKGNDKDNVETMENNDHQQQVGNTVVAGASMLTLNAGKNEVENADPTGTFADSSTQELTTTKVVALPKISNPKWRLFASGAVMAIKPGETALTSLSRSMGDSGSHTYYTASSLKFSYQPSFIFGLGVQRNIGKRWAVGAGIQYQQIKEQISLTGVEHHVETQNIARLSIQNGLPFLINEERMDTSSGTRNIEAQNSYRYVSIPIYAQYKFFQGRGAYLAIQMSAIINVSGKYHNSIQGDFEKTFGPAAQNFSHWGFDGQISLMAAKKLGNRFEVFVAPAWRINKSKPADQNLTNTYLNQFGIGFGVSYGFGH